MAQIYPSKRRPVLFSPFKVGRHVFYKGERYEIVVVDCWSPTETYLAIQKDLRIPQFEVVEAGEVDVIPSLY